MNGVIGPQFADIRQPHGVGQNRTGDLNDEVFLGEVAPKTSQGGRCVRRGDRAGPPATRDCGADFDRGNVGQVAQISGTGMGQSLDPACAELLNIPLDDGTAVEKIHRHVNGDSRMIVSETGSPWTTMGENSW